MAYQRLAYDDAATTTQMAADATLVGQELEQAGRGHPRRTLGKPGARFSTPEVSDELAALAAALELHLD